MVVKFVTFCVKAASVARWISMSVAAGVVALLIQVSFTPVGGPVAAAARFVGAAGETWNTIGRIMSFSSCPSRWQCHTYSQPKSYSWLVTVIGLFVSGSTPVNWVVVPSGRFGSSGPDAVGRS